ncbi:hypothetical protein VTO42DRAFT_3432 [Malbranchea cinnamomea]
MGDHKARYEAIPIPTYEEATSSRATPSSSNLGPEEVGDDAERQGLLSNGNNDQGAGRSVRYQPPTVESVRSSLDFLPSSNASSERGSTESLRRELEQMDVEEPTTQSSQSLFSKRLTTFRRTLSSLHLPLRKYLPNFKFNFNWCRLPDQSRQYKCILLLRVVAVLILAAVIYLLVVSDLFNLSQRLNLGQVYEPESVRIFVQSRINETNIAENLKMLTNFPHIAGTEGNYVLANWMEQRFKAAGLEDVHKERFDVYLNYPRRNGRRLAIVEPPEKAWEAKLDEEDVYKQQARQQSLVFHGHSKSGNVTGPLIYANYGSREDFKALAGMGIDVKGAIVLVRYYGTQSDRGLKVKAAELAGAAGCIIYSDPAEDGFTKGPPWPKGRYMPDDGVQRGAVSLMSWVVGDVLSPGFASLEDEKKRLSPEESSGLPKIPSIPISWRDAQQLLKVLLGHGKKVPENWIGAVPDIEEWWTGDSWSPKINLVNLQDEVERQPIYNVLGRIRGLEQEEKKIIIGSHRDAWCFGAADPGSGSAVLLEVVRIFGELRSLGWRPLRTIEFASWDGEEYNLIGSTEHVENRLEALRSDGVAYINVDVAVSGDKFRAYGPPLFERALQRVLKRTSDPNTNEPLWSIWEKEGSQLQGLGAGSDYVAFQDIAGMASVDIGFEGEPYPYHSCYDTFEWMERFGDPGFQYHRVLGQIWGLLLLEISYQPIIPFDLEAYAAKVTEYVDNLHKYAKKKGVPLKPLSGDTQSGAGTVDLKPLYDAARDFRREAEVFHQWGTSWNKSLYASGGYENNVMAIKRINYNSRMAYFDTNLLDTEEGGGVPNRTQFKHVIYGPQLWSGYDEAYFPAIRDAIDSGNWTATQQWVDKVAKIISFASARLNH